MSAWFWMINAAAKLASLALWHRSPTGAVGLFVAPDLVLLWGLFQPGAQLVCPEVTSFAPSPGAREVWLTIDDGPDPDDTPRILDLLDRHRARATFFVIGRRAAAHPGLLQEITRRGHEIGHHTASHPAAVFWLAGPRRIRRELDEPLATLAAAGTGAAVFRPPVGFKNLRLARLLRERGLSCIGWTIRSGDCFARDPAPPLRRVVAALRPGAIVLAHEGPSVPPALRVRFLAELLAALEARGYACVIPPAAQWLPALARPR